MSEKRYAHLMSHKKVNPKLDHDMKNHESLWVFYLSIRLLTPPMPSCFVPTPHAMGGGLRQTPLLYFLNPLPKELKILQTIRTLLANFRKVKMNEISFAWLP